MAKAKVKAKAKEKVLVEEMQLGIAGAERRDSGRP